MQTTAEGPGTTRDGPGLPDAWAVDGDERLLSGPRGEAGGCLGQSWGRMGRFDGRGDNG